MKRGVILAAIAGLAGLAALVVWSGWADVAAAIRQAGWTGFAAVTGFQILCIVICGLAWWVLPQGEPSLSWRFFVWTRWVRDGVGNLLALLPAGSELVGARVLALRGVDAPGAAASVVVDLTAELLSQVLFTIAGVLLLVALRPDSPVTAWGTIGIAVAVPAAVGFVVAQRFGLFRLLAGISEKLVAGSGLPWGEALHQRIAAIYRRRGRFLAGVALHLAGWLLSAGGVWAGLACLGHPVAFHEALVIESVVYAVRNAAFFVPWGAGVQEGGYVVLGALFGVPAGSMLALALLKRARDVALGAPAAGHWLLTEKRLAARRMSEI